MLNISILLRKKEDKYLGVWGTVDWLEEATLEIAAIAMGAPALLILRKTSGFIWTAIDRSIHWPDSDSCHQTNCSD